MRSRYYGEAAWPDRALLPRSPGSYPQRLHGHRIVSTRTSLAWHRRLVRPKWTRRPPPVSGELRDLITRPRTDNSR
ncbi:hypothetical protein [Saccharopolyspora spinosa]|uniref:hypothetical protein n=1 Tax=Saccharopolyspora spinosa TaxID=60894 RepID=UPI003747D077